MCFVNVDFISPDCLFPITIAAVGEKRTSVIASTRHQNRQNAFHFRIGRYSVRRERNVDT